MNVITHIIFKITFRWIIKRFFYLSNPVYSCSMFHTQMIRPISDWSKKFPLVQEISRKLRYKLELIEGFDQISKIIHLKSKKLNLKRKLWLSVKWSIRKNRNTILLITEDSILKRAGPSWYCWDIDLSLWSTLLNGSINFCYYNCWMLWLNFKLINWRRRWLWKSKSSKIKVFKIKFFKKNVVFKN